MRNERNYNSSLGPTCVGAIQTSVRGGPFSARVNRLGPVRSIAHKHNSCIPIRARETKVCALSLTQRRVLARSRRTLLTRAIRHTVKYGLLFPRAIVEAVAERLNIIVPLRKQCAKGWTLTLESLVVL